MEGSFSMSNRSSLDCDVLTTEDCSGSDDEEESKDPDMPPEFTNYFKIAVAKPDDFAAWTKLVAYAENKKNLAACRKALEAFLIRFPFSHIYWKKYADIELNLGSAEETEKIFARAVKANPLNVTIWTSYILFLLKQVNKKLPKTAETLQGVFNEAVDACGMEFRSDDIWNHYIEHEIKLGNFKQAMELYNRVLNIPTQRYVQQYERFKIFVAKYSPIELLTTEELNTIYSKIQDEIEDDQIVSEDVPSADFTESLTAEELLKIRQNILDTRKQMFLLNEEQVLKRHVFECGIKRLYYCASPLNVKQLQNWRKYLDFEKSQGRHERIIVLYERCLMPCAKYEEFWLSYAQYMEEYSVDSARAIFERACRVHLPLKFTLHLQWALFEEKHGQLDSARAIFRNLENVLPGVTMVRLRRVNFERRNGNLQEAERLLQEAARNSSGSEMATFYTVKLVRLVLKLKRDPEKARNILIEALKKEPNSPYLYQCLLEIEISRNAVDDVMDCVERALHSKIHDGAKGILSQRRLEYLEDCGNSIKSLLAAYDVHQTLLKRKTDEKDEEDENNKKSKSDSASPHEDISIPGVSQATTQSVALTQSVSTTTACTTISTTKTTQRIVEKVPRRAKPVKFQRRPVPRTQVWPYRPHRAMYIIQPLFRRPFPPPMHYIQPMPLHHMGGPPGPVPHNMGGLPGPNPHNMGGPPGPVPPNMGGPPGPVPPNMGGPPGPVPPNMGGPPGPVPPNMGGPPGPAPPNMGGPPEPAPPNMGGPPGPAPPNMGGPPGPTPPDMGGPPGPAPPDMGGPPGPAPHNNYGTWFQNFRGQGCPPPWNYNRFYPPY
ncbi:pre-mRNA-processing factor 39-like isoform X2 [Engystomops pustulosus]|uniref:pre-mRNA-processing factor 39-like isoform X2 n=1 Tax=Engystomops pustulosus TaxID=76066 RepID=UPI003AFA7EBB